MRPTRKSIMDGTGSPASSGSAAFAPAFAPFFFAEPSAASFVFFSFFSFLSFFSGALSEGGASGPAFSVGTAAAD